MCLYPRLIRNKKYTINEKNGGEIPPIKDERVKKVAIGCGKCIECRKQKANGWKVRLMEDLRVNKNAKFITLTYSDESLEKLAKGIKLEGYELDNEIARLSIRRFTENWRSKYGKTIRHWMVTEIGGKNTERLHIHGLVWTNKTIEEIDEKWIYGKVILGNGAGKHYVNEETIGYIVKYISKVDEKHKEYESKMFVSKGIGSEYINRRDSERNKYKGEKTIETYKSRTGLELGLPVYYRNKIYNDEEREKLWINRLDKGERWIMGVKVDIKEGEEEYYKLLKDKRKINKRLGYGDDSENWELKEYEKQRRNLKRKERIEKLWNTNASKDLLNQN